MIYYVIVCRSLTFAQKTAKILEFSGIPAAVIRVPEQLSDGGCSYGVKISKKWLTQAMTNLKSNAGEPLKVYMHTKDGYFEVKG